MPRHKQTEQPSSASAPKTRFQKFEYREIPRNTISSAAYNPRVITPYSRRLLKKKLEQVGCVEPLVFNAQTGNLVSGHQRISILDELEGNQDYMIAVAVVNLSDKREKEMAIFLNNAQAQGRYEKGGFAKLIEEGIDISEAGFTWADLEMEFGESMKLGNVFAQEEAAAAPAVEEIEAIKNRKKAVREENAENPSEDADYYLQVAFLSQAQKRQWLIRNGFSPDAAYLNAGEVGWAIEEPEPEQPEQQPETQSKQPPAKAGGF